MTENIDATPTPTPEKKSMSTGAKVGIGCGLGCLVVIIIAAALGLWGYMFVNKKIEDTTQTFQDQGYEVVKRQAIEVTQPIKEKKLYVAQMVKIMSDSSEDVAILAQMCELHGTMEGKVFFTGQVLIIQPNAVLKGGLQADAQAVQNYGTIEGEITGQHQIIEQ